MIASPFGSSFELILNMTDDLTVSNAATNLVVGLSGLSGGKTLTLPSIAQMVASQNTVLYVVNKSSSGGTVTVAANSADAIVGRATALVATGLTLRHDGLHTWFGM